MKRSAIQEHISAHRKKARRLRTLACLAALAIFCTAYALMRPAVTQTLACTIPEHVHTDDCYSRTPEEADLPLEELPLTCTDPDPDHVHIPRCYGTWVLTCGMEEHTHTEACFAAEEPLPAESSADGAEILPDPSADEPDVPADSTDAPDADELPAADDALPAGTLHISLLYGDEKPQSDHPDGVSYLTSSTMSGYLRLEPDDADADLTDVTVTLSLPKRYVDPSSFTIPPFSSNSSDTQYEILPLSEDDETYRIGIHFTVYDKTQTLVLPFTLKFLPNVVPDNYCLPVTASVSGGETTAPSIYRPEYKPWGIEKYVNSNRYKSFSEDGAEVVVTPLEENGNPYLDDRTYVDFAFIVNGCTSTGVNLSDWRDACAVTLTDPLPVYTDKDGAERLAVFDADANPGWTLSADGTSVSKTYQGENSADVLTQIYNDTLRLRFPGLQFTAQTDGTSFAELDNTVSLTAVPSNAADGETSPTAADSLRFRMTDDPATGGEFTKWATKGDIYDVDIYKTNPYPWEVALTNKKSQPLRHITIQDRKIVENGQTVLAGLDEALRFVRLESSLTGAKLHDEQTYADIVDHVTAYYTDGTAQDYPISLDSSGNFTVTFDENKICDGYDILFRDDYEMYLGERVSFLAYTVYRDPEHAHVPDGAEKVTYSNTARASNRYQSGGQSVTALMESGYSYSMLPSAENLSVNKRTLVNGSGTLWNVGGNHVGDTYIYLLQLRGTLLEPDIKEYQDLRIIDLLPDGVSYQKIYLIQQISSVGPILDGGTSYQPEIQENYHNSGRTAVIFHLNAANLKTALEHPTSGCDIYFGVTIDQDAHSGTVRNDVYVVGDNLDEYSGDNGVDDIYDLNNNGRTDDKIAHGYSDATIIAAQSVYAEKFIAPAGSDNWSRQGLLVNSGSQFDYLLKITNETSAEYTGLTLTDVLPQIGDKNAFATADRNSEFRVRLREAITPPASYSVLYTTAEVSGKSIQELADAAIWTDTVSDWSAVTAFRLVAGADTILPGRSTFEVRIPAEAPAALDDASLALLHKKAVQRPDAASCLEAFNAFGFRTAQSSLKESNTVWARIPFADLCVQKVDGTTGTALPGAQFTLTDASGSIIGTAVSDECGLLRFRDLTAGVYTLAETQVPDGYRDTHLTMTVTITQNPVTMEYEFSFSGSQTGSGTSADPLRIENYSTPELPYTGGPGLLPFCAAGILLLGSAALLFCLRRRKSLPHRP